MTRFSVPANPHENVAALILCGGEGRRMGSVEKGLQRLGGKPLLTHVMERLRSQVSILTLCCNRALPDYQHLFHGPIIGDAPALEGYGPLAGMVAGLAFYRELNQRDMNGLERGGGLSLQITEDRHFFRLHSWSSSLLEFPATAPTSTTSAATASAALPLSSQHDGRHTVSPSHHHSNSNHHDGGYTHGRPSDKNELSMDELDASAPSCTDLPTIKWLMVVPCDTPLIPHDLVGRLLQSAQPEHEIMVAVDASHEHYTHVLLRMDVLDRLVTHVGQSQRLKTLYDAFNVGRVLFPLEECFVNLNTRDDLAEVESRHFRGEV